jgi:hypothetical protein
MVDALALPLSPNKLSLIPESHKYSQNYRVTRINLEPIDITEETANFVFKKILSGDHAIVLGKHLVMCSCISSIDPLPIIPKPKIGHYEGNKFIED